MNRSPWNLTLALVAVAGCCAGLVALTAPTPRGPAALRADQGQPLAPALTDPQKVTSLEVIGWDDASARPRGFKVAMEGGKWVIPSAFNYPADATQQMATTATSFVGLNKDRVISDDPALHAQFGVIDPGDEKNPATTGRGTRVTLKDVSGAALVDIIVGNGVPSDSPDAAGAPTQKYVRLAGSNRVYATALNLAFSTKLADWINQDLLLLTPTDAQRVDIDRYKIDERTGEVTGQRSLALSRLPAPANADPAKPAPTWSISTQEGDKPVQSLVAGETLDEAKINDTIQKIAGLRIIAVRKKPANLASMLGKGETTGRLTITDQASMQTHGFFLTPKGNMLANEGQLSVTASDGVRSTLWLGELALDESTKGQTTDATGSDASKTRSEGGSEGEKSTAAIGRYVMITVEADLEQLGAAPVKPEELTKLEAESAAATAEAPMAEDRKNLLTQLKANYDAATAAYDARKKAAEEKAAKQSKRFADWYYVVDAKDLDAIRPERATLVKAATPPVTPTAPQPPAAAPMPAPAQP